MKTKYLSIFLGMILPFIISEELLAQHCVSFCYDADGNRIESRISYDCDKDESVQADDALANVQEYEIQLYPSPVSNELCLSVPFVSETNSVSYCIFDERGVLCQRGPVDSENIMVNVGSCMPGVYVMVISRGDETFSRTFVKL